MKLTGYTTNFLKAIDRALSIKAKDRPQDVQEFQADIAGLLVQQVIAGQCKHPVKDVVKSKSKSKILLLVVLALLIVATFFVYQDYEQKRELMKVQQETEKKRLYELEEARKKETERKREIERKKAKKNQFLAQVRQKINQHKSYPKIAQRRGLQGKVKVRFTILANGNVGHISLSGPKVFHNSARRAVKGAFPINTKNAPISLPQSVNLTLRYQLR